MLVLGITIVLYVMAAQKGYWSGDGPIQDGFTYNPTFTANKYEALCYVIPIIAFGFLGVETFAATAFEARSSRSLRFPSQTIAYFTLGLYFLCLLGQCLNVSWLSDHLPLIYGGIGDSITDTKDLMNPRSSSLTVIALWDWGQKGLAGFLNGAMIFSVMSASNTSLYVASRTLYGLALDVPTTSRAGRMLHSFSVVVPQTGVPARALIFSAMAFFWLPFVNLKQGYAVQYVSLHFPTLHTTLQANTNSFQLIEIVQISSSVSCLIVWAALSCAYLRYYLWLKKCKDHLQEEYAQFVRSTKTYKPFTLLAFAQPLPALTSLAGCLVVFAFCSATWWNSPVTFSKVAIGYAAPIILLAFFIIFKLINRRLWVRTGTDFTKLSQTLDRLKWYKPDEVSPREEQMEATRVLSPPLAASSTVLGSHGNLESPKFAQVTTSGYGQA
ncbi:hypothetical protein K458DRAFT_173161 [Lentithecium fluviatile CBS 122367]|uniref:Amino acid permease/ SLC12A domain-containing protein n=1 Tax=Lentithecium fluviatile CBS 122367 TaxID=1168545 RepID=A0A6G1JBK2_9PLEO|nr:hypothetical protein K458DRAFT_173161 [Lentithecium fluviatile CBS 122367]